MRPETSEVRKKNSRYIRLNTAYVVAQKECLEHSKVRTLYEIHAGQGILQIHAVPKFLSISHGRIKEVLLYSQP